MTTATKYTGDASARPIAGDSRTATTPVAAAMVATTIALMLRNRRGVGGEGGRGLDRRHALRIGVRTTSKGMPHGTPLFDGAFSAAGREAAGYGRPRPPQDVCNVSSATRRRPE